MTQFVVDLNSRHLSTSSIPRNRCCSRLVSIKQVGCKYREYGVEYDRGKQTCRKFEFLRRLWQVSDEIYKRFTIITAARSNRMIASSKIARSCILELTEFNGLSR